MEKIYLIKTKCGDTVRLRFEEVHGNGKYILIVNLNTHKVIAYVDHVQFNLTEFCKSYIKQYFGQNLKTFYEED